MSSIHKVAAALAHCPTEHVFALLGGKWKIAILAKIAVQPRRFGELQRLMEGITHKMLTQQLRQLERDGLVRRTVLSRNPPGVEYSLSNLGESLREALEVIDEWGRAHLPIEIQGPDGLGGEP